MPKKNLLGVLAALSIITISSLIASKTHAVAEIIIDPITKTISITGLDISTGTTTTTTT